MSEKESLSERMHDFAEKVETDIKEHERKHAEAVHERDKEIEREKKLFEKHQTTVGTANMLALEGEDIVTDD